MNPVPTPADLARQLESLAETYAMPSWLKANILNMAAHIDVIAPREQDAEKPPVYVYFH
jgi:hypothetical protein